MYLSEPTRSVELNPADFDKPKATRRRLLPWSHRLRETRRFFRDEARNQGIAVVSTKPELIDGCSERNFTYVHAIADRDQAALLAQAPTVEVIGNPRTT